MPICWDQKCTCGDIASRHDDRPGLPNGGPCNLCSQCKQFTAPPPRTPTVPQIVPQNPYLTIRPCLTCGEWSDRNHADDCPNG